MKTVLVTGANRGLGLEFCRQYLQQGDRVIATARNMEAAALNELKSQYSEQMELLSLDVSSEASRRDLVSALEGRSLDLLINNAGYYGKHNRLGQLDDAEWAYEFTVNTIGPIRLAEALMPNLSAGKQPLIAMLSSKMGSIADNGSGGSYLYRSSKAALNAAGRSLAVDLSQHGINVVLLHPGWVQTDMGGPNGLIDSETSVQGMRNVIDAMDSNRSGRFFAYDGAEIPW